MSKKPAPDFETLLERNPATALLQHTELAKELGETLNGKGKARGKALPTEAAAMILAEFRAEIRQFGLCEDGLQEEGLDGSGETLRAMQEITRKRIGDLVKEYGPQLLEYSNGQERFAHTVNYVDGGQPEPTIANFLHVRSILRIAQESRNKVAQSLGKIASAPFGRKAGFETMRRRMLTHERKDEAHLGATLRVMWQNEDVQEAWVRHQHLAYTKAAYEGAPIIEGPSTVILLNRIHKELAINTASGSTGVALVGQPGWGKTEILIHYFRETGLEPLSLDLSETSNAAILMARPILHDSSPFSSIDTLVEAIDTLEYADLLQLIEREPELCAGAGLTAETLGNEAKSGARVKKAREMLAAPLKERRGEAVANALKTQLVQRGVQFGPIIRAAILGQPVILNEAVNLRLSEAPSLNGLMTTVPATDEEAGDMPAGKEAKGPVKGWFFEPVSSTWIRVRKGFSMNITANVGSEHRNTGLPPAWENRYKGGLITIPLPEQKESVHKEYLRTIMWPNLSDPDTGRFQLDDKAAYRLHFLVERVIPHVLSTLELRRKPMPPISIRTLKDLCQRLLPKDASQTRSQLDTAVWDAVIAPMVGNMEKYGETLTIMLAWLLGTGTFHNLDAINKKAKSLLSEPMYRRMHDTMSKLSSGIKTGDAKTDVPDDEYAGFHSYSEASYTKPEDNIYTGRCSVCGVTACPCHGIDTMEYLDHVKRVEEAAQLGLSPSVIAALGQRQDALLKGKHWGMFVELYVSTEGAKRLLKVPAELEGYLQSLVDQCKADPAAAKDHILTLKRCADLALPMKVESEWFKPINEYWQNRVSDVIAGLHDRELELRALTLPRQQEEADRINREIARTYRDVLDPAVRVLHTVQEWHSAAAPLREDISMLRETLMRHASPATLVLLSELQGEEASAEQVSTWKKSVVNQRKASFTKELADLRKQLGKAPELPTSRGRAKAPAPVEDLDALPKLTQQYGELQKALRHATALASLDAVKANELAELMSHAAALLKDGFEPTQPEACMPFVRCAQTLSDAGKNNLGAVLRYFFEKREEPMPPVRTF
jgi:hypothetical protein